MTHIRRRPVRSGRRVKLKERAEPPAQNPCPPGQRGGTYMPLTEAECAQIYQMAVRLLEELGMGEVPPQLATQLKAHGAVERGGRVLFPAALIEAAVAAAPRNFTLYGRDPARDIEVGEDRVHFGTGGAAVQTLDLETGDYRPSTLRDLYDFTRLQDGLANVSWFTRCCVATDMPDEWSLDVNTVFALLKGTTKPAATSFSAACSPRDPAAQSPAANNKTKSQATPVLPRKAERCTF